MMIFCEYQIPMISFILASSKRHSLYTMQHGFPVTSSVLVSMSCLHRLYSSVTISSMSCTCSHVVTGCRLATKALRGAGFGPQPPRAGLFYLLRGGAGCGPNQCGAGQAAGQDMSKYAGRGGMRAE